MQIEVVRKTKNEMNQTWRKKDEGNNSGTIEVEITQSNGLGDHTTSKQAKNVCEELNFLMI